MGYTFGGKDREGVVMLASELEEFSGEIVKDALTRLSPVGQYTVLMDMLPNVNVFKDKEFRSGYEEFYKLKRYPAEFRDAYFAFMQKNKGNASLLPLRKSWPICRRFGGRWKPLLPQNCSIPSAPAFPPGTYGLANIPE
jgi:hypothetical protein